MTVRDLDIDIDVEVGVSELVRANQLADEFKDTLNDIKDVISIQVDVNDGGTLAELKEIERLTKELDRQRVHIDVSIDNIANEIAQINAQLRLIDASKNIDIDFTDVSLAMVAVNKLDAALRQLDDTVHIGIRIDDVTAELTQLQAQTQAIDQTRTIDIDFAGVLAATRAVEQLNSELRQIDRNIKIDVDIDLSDFLRDIQAIRTQLATIRRHDIDVDVDTAGAMAQIAALQAQLAALQASTRINLSGLSSNGMLGALGSPLSIAAKIAALAVLLPALSSLIYVTIGAVGTLGVAIGVLAGGLFALVSALGVALIGLGGFAMLAVSTIVPLYDEKAKLTTAQKELKKQTDSVADSWNSFKNALQGTTFDVVKSGVGVINQLLTRSEPLMKNVGTALSDMMSNLNQSLNGNRMTNFFDYLERAMAPLSTNIGNGLGYALQGVFNWMVALEPLTNWVAQGFENMMSRFADWTAGLQGSDRMTAFMDYVMQNMPKIGEIIGGATDGVIGFFEAFDVTGADGLTWMAEKMQEFAEWSAGLDENQGFQNMLNIIKTDGPVVAEILGGLATTLMDLTEAFANFGRGEGETNGGLKYLQNLTNGTFIPKEIKWVAKFFGFGKDEVPDVEVDVKANTTNFTADMNNLKTTTPNVEVPTIPKIDPLTFRSGFTSPITVPVKASELKINQEVPAVDVPAKVSKIDTSQLGPVKLPIQLPANDASNGFKWPPYPVFAWPSLPKFEWPVMPRFTWPAYPRFTWPPMPTVTVNVAGANVPGFSSGLGRVKQDMPAIIHKNEAILQDHNAGFLRDNGILVGDGRNPQINTEALANYGSAAGSRVSAATTSTTTTSQSTVVDVGGIQITVQGGNTNAETGQAAREAVESLFADLGIVMPNYREG